MLQTNNPYQWLEDLINSLPELPKERRNFFDISGFPSWENVNSNFLAFYLQENEQHNFKKLFFNSLLDCISIKINGDRLDNKTCDCKEDQPLIFKKENFDSPFSVYREYTTLKGGRIDLLIESESNDSETEAKEEDQDQKEDWAIIIENKIYHELKNDLNDYWNTVKAKNKIGIVLSQGKTNLEQYNLNNGIEYITITHKELVNTIESNLSEYFLEADDRHLLFLKEYFLNIKNLYKNYNPEHIMKEQLIQFHNEHSNIVKLLDVNTKLLEYVNKSSIKAFNKLGCKPNTNSIGTKSKHFYFDQKNELFNSRGWDKSVTDNFRFYVDMNRLRFKNEYQCMFEIFGKNHKEFGNKLIKALEENDINFPKHFKTEVQGGNNQTHLMWIKFNMNDLESKDYSKIVFEELKKRFTVSKELDVLDIVFNTWKTINL